jgi:pyruvate formate lyase activating enzyme
LQRALQPILDTIRLLHDIGFWLEIVTLVIPGFNDSDDELTRLAEFLAGVSLDIPWHVTAFHKDYKMTDPENTSPETLIRAAEIGKKTGLRYVYAGNLPGQVGDLENTRCPNCKTLLIERFGYLILGYLSLAKTLGVLSFTPLTMLQACAQAVDFKVGHHFGEGQPCPWD